MQPAVLQARPCSSAVIAWLAWSALGVAMTIPSSPASRRSSSELEGLVDPADVEEVAQDVLVAVAETIRGYRGESRFTTWLYQVARFKAIAHLRRTRPSMAVNGSLGGPSPGPGAPSVGADIEPPEVGDSQRISSMIATRTSVDEALQGLPERYRAPVMLRDVEQLPYDVIARRLELNINTAKTRVARGRALVAAHLSAGS
jgi:RNA polymerase sigma-70 factor, ECF subfamily